MKLIPQIHLAIGFLIGLSFTPAGVAGGSVGEVLSGRQPETSLAFWEWRYQGVSFKLVQRLPDQTRAFFLGRGFTRNAADKIARSCVFQSIFRNEGGSALDYTLKEWRIHQGDRLLSMRLQDQWDEQWRAEEVPPAARIAFRWSLLPPEQHFEPGDYNWGMTSFGPSPGELFDLELVIHIDGQRITGRIANIQCPTENLILQGQP